MYGAEQSRHRPHSTTPTHNEKGHAIHCCRLLLYQSYVGYEKKKKFRTKEEEETEEQERERERKSHGIKQSEPRARQRSDCVAE